MKEDNKRLLMIMLIDNNDTLFPKGEKKKQSTQIHTSTQIHSATNPEANIAVQKIQPSSPLYSCSKLSH